MFVGGWFDAEDLAGPLKLFRAVKSTGPQSPNVSDGSVAARRMVAP